MKKVRSTAVLMATLASAGIAHASEPAPAPDVMITLDGALVTNSSSNFGPAIKQVIGDYNDDGPCEESNDWATCDRLRFGLSIHAGPQCTDSDPVAVFYDPGEDVGIDDIKPRLNGIPSEGNSSSGTYCGYVPSGNSGWFRNHDTAQTAVWEYTFPGTTSASEAQLDQYWERPNLQIFVTDGFPQTDDGDDDDRVINTLAQVCQMHAGPAGLPSMPTWVFVERMDTDPEVLYGDMVAAAGGTGECQERQGMTWVDIDVCDHINETSVSESTLRNGIQSGKYRCSEGAETFQTGALDYELSNGNVGTPFIRCHLTGGCNRTQPDTDLLGILACVRQIPRGFTSDDVNLCRETSSGEMCETLADADVEWIDDNNTLFVIPDTDDCDAYAVSTCIEDVPCSTGLEGRCAIGHTDCSTGTEVCVSDYEGYPEICNGLDDDCDGEVDNMKDSWDKSDYSSYSLPDDHVGLDCNRIDVCMCPDGATDTHDGGSYDDFLDSWSGVCQCGEGLDDGYYSPTAPESAPMGESDAACSAVAANSVPVSFLGLMLLGIVGFFRRRKD